MKGPFSFWTFFGLTIIIDLLTHLYYPKKIHRIDPYHPVRKVSVIIPIHKEPAEYIEKTILALYSERYPLKKVILCGNFESQMAY